MARRIGVTVQTFSRAICTAAVCPRTSARLMLPLSSSAIAGASQNGGELSSTSYCSQAAASSGYTSQQNRRCNSLLTALSSLLAFGRSGLRPSLVRGDSPRNAPLRMPDRRGQLELFRPRPVFAPRAATVGAGPVPARCLPRLRNLYISPPPHPRRLFLRDRCVRPQPRLVVVQLDPVFSERKLVCNHGDSHCWQQND